MIGIVIVIICAVIIFWIFASKYKCLKAGNLTEFTGGVKQGKTQVCVREVFKRYNCQRLKWRINCLKAKIKKTEMPEEPLIYSNVPIGRTGFNKLVPLSYEILTLQERVRHGSVIYLCEAALVNSCMDVKNETVNDVLTLFYKLCAHLGKGSYVYADTQSPLDVHYSCKRALSTYYQIFDRTPIKILGFELFSLIHLREMLLNAGDISEQVHNEDPQDAHNGGLKGTYWHIVGRKWFKYYDRYCYYSLVADKPIAENCVTVSKNKQAKRVLRVKNYIKKMEQEGKKIC